MASSSSSSITSTTSSSGTKRVTGLYSNMDIDSMVSASLTNDQTKIDNMQKNIDYAEWKKEAYQDINTLVSDFQNKYFSYTSSTSLLTSTAMNLKTITTTGSTSAVTISAGSSATVDSFQITKATAASTAKVTTGSISGADYTDMTTSDGSAVTENNATVQQLADALGITLNYSRTETSTVTSTDDEGNETTEDVTTNYISLTIGDKTIEIDTSKSLGDMMSSINNSDSGVKITYNSFSQKFDFKATSAGADGNFTITGNDGLFFGTSGILGTSSDSVTTTNGTNASITIVDENGDESTYENPTNSFTKAGFTFTINESFDSTATGSTDEAISVKMGTDVDTMVEKITNFVNDYNTLITALNKAVTEKRDYDYDPLTEAEKEELSDSEITKLETKAKAGILYGDSGIKSLLSNMRSSLNNIETSTGLKLRDIGISTGNYFSSSTAGALEIDETKLRSAIENNSTDVANLFTQAASTSTSSSSKSLSAGIATTFKSLTSGYVTNSKNITISSLTTKISNYEDRLDRLKDLFADREDALYSEFATLETLLAQMDASASMFYSS